MTALHEPVANSIRSANIPVGQQRSEMQGDVAAIEMEVRKERPELVA